MTVALPAFNFSVGLDVVPGDVTGDRAVSPADYASARAAYGRTTLDEGTSPRHYTVFRDVNGSGAISATDLGTIRGNLGGSLASFQPPPAVPFRLAGIVADEDPLW